MKAITPADKPDAKHRILTTGAELVHRQGYNNTGIQEILKAAGVPKGSFYFHFKNKEDFGLQLIDHFGEHFRSLAQSLLTDTTVPPRERVAKFFGVFHEFFTTQGFVLGCPVGNLAQEMGDLSPIFAEKLSQAIDQMAAALVPVLQEAQAVRPLAHDADPTDLAYFIVSAWHGALVRMKVTKSREPLNLFEKMVFGSLLG